MRSDFSPTAAAAAEMFAMDVGLKFRGRKEGSTKDSVKDAA